MITFFGDSISNGYGVLPAESYVGLFGVNEAADDSQQAAEVSSDVMQLTPDLRQAYGLMIGLNDVSMYKDDAAKMEFFRRALRACVAWFCLYDRKIARGPQAGIEFTGAWIDSPTPNTCGKYTTEAGAKGRAIVTGDTAYIALSEGRYEHYDFMSHNIRVVIDGVDKGPHSVDIPGVTTWLKQWWSRTVWKFDNLGPGDHAVEITNLDGGRFLHLDYIAGNYQPSRPEVLLGLITKCTTAWYAVAGVTPALVQSYNAIVADIAAELGATLVNTWEVLDPAIHLQPDGAHPNKLGHRELHWAFWDAL